MDSVFVQAIVVGVLTGGIYGLFAVGLSLIMGIANIMTFVHGDFLMIAMYLTLVFTLSHELRSILCNHRRCSADVLNRGNYLQIHPGSK